MDFLIMLNRFFGLIIQHTHEAAAFVLIMWLIHLLNNLLGMKLNILGVIPRKKYSLLTGPLFSSFLHADLNHLFYNTFPLIIFSAIIFANGITIATCTIMSISILSGIIVWFIGRPGIHIGASGLIMGFMGYLLYNSYYSPGFINIGIGLVVLYYFGSLLLSIFPDDLSASFEGHAAGLISGAIVAAYGQCLSFMYNISKPLTISIKTIASYLT